jgi:curved DNA-binding protein
MAGSRDYYELLGVARDATADEIRKAFRKLARQYHPDVNKSPDAATRFAEINEAYEVLSDAQKRKAYDQFGHAGVGVGAPGGGRATWTSTGGPGGPGGAGGFDVDDLGSIFEEMFGARGGASPFGGRAGSPFGGAAGPRAAPPPQRGRDLRHEITVSFMTAARGGKEQLRLSGEGGAETISVTIPPGIESGAKLRVKGKGQPGMLNGPPGDLMLTVKVGNHPYFRREGLDLMVDVPITIVEAVTGATVSVPLLEGTVDLKVPPGSSSGQKLRVRGKGLKGPGGKRGDFYAVIQIVAPTSLSDEAMKALENAGAELKNPRESAPWTRDRS